MIEPHRTLLAANTTHSTALGRFSLAHRVHTRLPGRIKTAAAFIMTRSAVVSAAPVSKCRFAASSDNRMSVIASAQWTHENTAMSFVVLRIIRRLTVATVAGDGRYDTDRTVTGEAGE